MKISRLLSFVLLAGSFLLSVDCAVAMDGEEKKGEPGLVTRVHDVIDGTTFVCDCYGADGTFCENVTVSVGFVINPEERVKGAITDDERMRLEKTAVAARWFLARRLMDDSDIAKLDPKLEAPKWDIPFVKGLEEKQAKKQLNLLSGGDPLFSNKELNASNSAVTAMVTLADKWSLSQEMAILKLVEFDWDKVAKVGIIPFDPDA